MIKKPSVSKHQNATTLDNTRLARIRGGDGDSEVSTQVLKTRHETAKNA